MRCVDGGWCAEHGHLLSLKVNGSGDALTTYGTIYMVDSKLTGHGDTILAYAALFRLRCEIQSSGPFTWTRTPEGRHGNVFVDSKFIALDEPQPWKVSADGLETGDRFVETIEPHARLILPGVRSFENLLQHHTKEQCRLHTHSYPRCEAHRSVVIEPGSGTDLNHRSRRPHRRRCSNDTTRGR